MKRWNQTDFKTEKGAYYKPREIDRFDTDFQRELIMMNDGKVQNLLSNSVIGLDLAIPDRITGSGPENGPENGLAGPEFKIFSRLCLHLLSIDYKTFLNHSCFNCFFYYDFTRDIISKISIQFLKISVVQSLYRVCTVQFK